VDSQIIKDMRLTISYRRRLWPAPDGANGAIVQASL